MNETAHDVDAFIFVRQRTSVGTHVEFGLHVAGTRVEERALRKRVFIAERSGVGLHVEVGITVEARAVTVGITDAELQRAADDTELRAEVNAVAVKLRAVETNRNGVFNVADGGRKHSVIKKILKNPHAKAAAELPEADRIISDSYAALRKAEEEKLASLDRVSEYFASMLEKLFASVALTECKDEYYAAEMRKLCYNIGKFVYLADAVDDIDEDFRAGRYNPVLAVMPDYEKGKPRDYKKRHRAQLEFSLNSTVNRAIESVNHIRLTQANDLVRNIIYEGLRAKTEELLAADKKLPPPSVYASDEAKEEMKKIKKRKKADKGDNGKG